MDNTHTKNIATNLRLIVTALNLNEQNLLDKVVKKGKKHYLPLTPVSDGKTNVADLYNEFAPNRYLIQQLEIIIEKMEENHA